MTPPKPTKLSAKLSERLVQLQDPIVFMEHCVFTQDEVDANRPVKLAPMHREYLHSITRVWQQYDKVLIDKSRRMWISWWALAVHLHLAFTSTNRRVGIVTEKADKSNEHLVNMKFIYDHIPADIYPPECRPTFRMKEGRIYFDEVESTIHGLASGPDQARQFGFSALFFDECDFWEDTEATYGAAKPTLQGGGKLTIVSTHNWMNVGAGDSFYKRILEDNL